MKPLAPAFSYSYANSVNLHVGHVTEESEGYMHQQGLESQPIIPENPFYWLLQLNASGHAYIYLGTYLQRRAFKYEGVQICEEIGKAICC